MRRGATEELIDRIGGEEVGDVPERTRAALALADHLSRGSGDLDPATWEELRRWFTEEQILDLGMCLGFATGWQRFIEAFGIVPDWWRDGAPPPWAATPDDDPAVDQGVQS